jgi:hypothetical protein
MSEPESEPAPETAHTWVPYIKSGRNGVYRCSSCGWLGWKALRTTRFYRGKGWVTYQAGTIVPYLARPRWVEAAAWEQALDREADQNRLDTENAIRLREEGFARAYERTETVRASGRMRKSP